MKDRRKKFLRPASREVALVLTALLLLAAFSLRPRYRSAPPLQDPGVETHRLQDPGVKKHRHQESPASGEAPAASNEVEAPSEGTATLRDAFYTTRRARYRSSGDASKKRVEVEAWGTPENLIISLYSAATIARVSRFRLIREAGGGYRLLLEAIDE
jgi:hypothetical protein